MSQNLKEILRNKDLFDPKTVSRPARAELAKDKKFFIEMLESANFPAIKFLVESGADVRVKLAKGMNALGWVLFRDGNVSERQKSVDFLLASGATNILFVGTTQTPFQKRYIRKNIIISYICYQNLTIYQT